MVWLGLAWLDFVELGESRSVGPNPSGLDSFARLRVDTQHKFNPVDYCCYSCWRTEKKEKTKTKKFLEEIGYDDDGDDVVGHETGSKRKMWPTNPYSRIANPTVVRRSIVAFAVGII